MIGIQNFQHQKSFLDWEQAFSFRIWMKNSDIEFFPTLILPLIYSTWFKNRKYWQITYRLSLFWLKRDSRYWALNLVLTERSCQWYKRFREYIVSVRWKLKLAYFIIIIQPDSFHSNYFQCFAILGFEDSSIGAYKRSRINKSI